MPHIPVLLGETIAAISPRTGGRYIDGTLGGGGHAEAVLRAGAPGARLLGLDRDEDAIARCKERLAPFGDRFTAVHTPFSGMAEAAAANGFDAVDGILLDLGVSSFQIDEADRGFSFRADGPLDMRMDRSRGMTAAELLASFGEDWRALAELIRCNGEEPDAGRIARAIIAEQIREPVSGTARLAEIIEKAVGGRRGRARHPATRTFQALRIAVNRELDEVSSALETGISLLAEGGVFAVITFHSLEDRIVKRAFAAHEGREVSLQQGGSRWEGALPRVRRLHRHAISPSETECAENPRARSAKLRAVKRITRS